MAKTRTTFSFPDDDDDKRRKDLIAAAFILEEKSRDSLLYNSQVIDYITNGIEAGDANAAWFYWSRIPELRYVSRYIANALSVATLYAGKADNSGGHPVHLPDSHPASQLLSEFAGGFTGQKELLDRLGLHLTVAGDSVLIGPKSGSNMLQAPFDQWRVYSTQEVHSRNGKIYLLFPGNSKEIQIPEGAMAVRIWRPHPKLWWDADSPVKGSFQVLKELDMLNMHILSSAASRLSGAGLLLIPEEFDLPGADTETEGTEIDQFVALMIEVMGIAKKNPESPAAQIPIMARGPSDVIDKWKHIDFATKFDEMVPDLRQGAIRRLALGMDVPPEILLGSEQSTSWSAWQTDESTLRVHLIPLLQLICSSLTVGWLRPMLEQLPLTDTQKEELSDIVIHYDVSGLKIHQDISGDAQALYDRFGIDADTLRMAIGYSDDTAPDDKELARQILYELVKSGNPQMVPYAITALRNNFGLDMLPDVASTAGEVFPRATEKIGPDGKAIPDTKAGAAGAAAAPPGNQPGVKTPPTKTTPIASPVPGERSQAKQTSPPPTPKPGGDQSNNAKGK
jgi:hypothetical protein